MNENYLRDKDFLLSLNKTKNKKILIKLTALDFQEKPIEFLQGRATGGSITVDGKSAMRRSCSLSLVSQDLNLNNFLWSLNTKFKLEIGLENKIDDRYPDTIWFNQGIYIITSFSSSITENSLSISISGKDKMALLNGEVSGHFGQTTVLDIIEEEDKNGNIIRTKFPLYNIMVDMLQMYGNEQLYNIYINDLDNLGLKLIKYIGNSPMYITQPIKIESGKFIPLDTFNFSTSIKLTDYWVFEDSAPALNNENKPVGGQAAGTDTIFSKFNLDTDQEQQVYFAKYSKSSGLVNPNTFCFIYKINYGDIVGYQATPMVYNDDLIAQPGEAITSILDKIVNMLGGSYEYFYDLDGHFIFQRKQNYVDMAWSPYEFFSGDTVTSVKVSEDEYIYRFNDLELIKSINFTPQINAVKNDFIVYGETDNGYPLHLRYAIDKKPERYYSLQKSSNKILVYETDYSDLYTEYLTKGTPPTTAFTPEKQMFYPNKNGNYFSMTVNNFNKNSLTAGMVIVIKTGKKTTKLYTVKKIEDTILGRKRIYVNTKNTSELLGIKEIVGYGELANINNFLESEPRRKQIEEYVNTHKEIICDWREIIYQMAVDFRKHGQEDNYISRLQSLNPELCKNGKTGYEQYYTDLLGFWPDLYRYKTEQEGKTVEVSGWNLEQIKNIDTYFYWLDFIEGGQTFDTINVQQIGDRTLVKSDKNVKCLFEKDIPPLLIYTGDVIPATTLTYTPVKLTSNVAGCMSLASLPKAAKNVIDNEISNNTALSSSISLTTIPIYYLEPNHKILIDTNEKGVRGQFLINSFTIPLSYNGMMNISATEVVANLY